MKNLFRIAREKLEFAFGGNQPPAALEEFRFEVFDCGISQGKFRMEFQAKRRAARCWGGYVIDRETGERV